MRLATRSGGGRPRRSAIPGAILAGCILAAGTSGLVLAHGGAARLAADPDRVRPGGVVTMRGEDLGSDAVVTLTLIGSTGQIALGSIVADEEGHLSSSVQIPVELPVGIYRLEGSPDGAAPLAASLVVEGEALPTAQQEVPGSRDDDDGLLIALPSGWQQALGEPPITAVPVTIDDVRARGRGADPVVLVLIVILALGGALGIGALARRRRTPA